MATPTPVWNSWNFKNNTEIQNAVLKNVTLDASVNAVSKLNLAMFAAGVVVEAMPGTPDHSTIMTSQAVYNYIQQREQLNHGQGKPTGYLDISSGTVEAPASANGGDWWVVIGGASSTATGVIGGKFTVTNGDTLVALDTVVGGAVIAAGEVAKYQVNQTNIDMATTSEYGYVKYADPTGADLYLSTENALAVTPLYVKNAISQYAAAIPAKSYVKSVASLSSVTIDAAEHGLGADTDRIFVNVVDGDKQYLYGLDIKGSANGTVTIQSSGAIANATISLYRP